MLLLLMTACLASPGSALPDTASGDTASGDTGTTTGTHITTSTGDTGDTGDTGETGTTDLDGDGWPAIGAGVDPSLADCDDNDPLVTPLTERYLPAGDAWEGRDNPDKERPQRVVSLSAYCVDITEVDNDHVLPFLQQVLDERGALIDEQDRLLYDLVDGDDEVPERIEQHKEKLSVVKGYGDHPTVEITWYGADAYCRSRDQRLPTEAEWERAANGGCGEDGCDSSIPPVDWPWGDADPDCDHLNGAQFATDSKGRAMPKWIHCVGETTPTGQPPGDVTPEGIFGLAGNVSEWTQDWYQPGDYTEKDPVDPQGPETGEMTGPDGTVFQAKVSRGTSWAGDFYAGTTFARTPDPIDGSSNGVGFRCVRQVAD